jgi:hypothetical protein
MMMMLAVISLTGCPDPPTEGPGPNGGGEIHHPGQKKGGAIDDGPNQDDVLQVTSIEECYPEKMTQRAVSILKIGGRASRQDWGLKGVNNFAYRYRVVSELAVIDNSEGRIRFRKKILDVHQVNAVSKQTLEISLPTDPIMAATFREAERIFLMPVIPGYPLVKRLAELMEAIDPNLKATLTAIQKEFGLSPTSSHVQLKVDDLAGRTFDIEWVKDVGVDVDNSKEIDVKQGRTPFNEKQLKRFFNSVTLLSDFLLLDGKARKIGDAWSIDASHVREVLQFGMDYDVKGKLQVKRVKDKNAETALIEVVGGDLEVSTVDEERDQRGVVKVIDGELQWSKTDKMISRGRFEIDGDTLVRSRNHLLFKAEVESDLEIKAYYESEKIGP